MVKICKNCGVENKDSASFCNKCGNSLHTGDKSIKDNKKTIIIVLVAIAAILAIGIGVYASCILAPEVPLVTEDFGILEMSVPEGAYFEEFTSIPSFGNIGGFISLENKGNYSSEVTMFVISKMVVHFLQKWSLTEMRVM